MGCPAPSKPAARRAIAILYLLLALPVLLGLLMLAVDVGRVVCAKSELQGAADAAARYAAAGMIASSTRKTTAYNQAVAVCNDIRADSQAIAVQSADVELGIWNAGARTFTTTTNESLANAVRVTLRCQVGGGQSSPLFGQAIGARPQSIRASAIATATAVSVTVTAPSKGNLWLAGMPDNTAITNLQSIVSKYDSSGTAADKKERPQEVSLASVGLAPGDLVSFEGLSGQGNNGAGASNTGPDGNQTWNVALGNSAPTAKPSNSVNGISNVRAPIAACMAVFLGAAAPNLTAAPACLDFSTQAQRDYSLLEPQLKQSFFVGDGKGSWGEVQHIRVPAGATRIFLGMMDAWQWNDNTGQFTLKFYRSTAVTTVR